MSRTGNGRDRRIDTDGQWAREVERRLSAIEKTKRIGGWVLSEQDGEIVATKPGRALVSITAALQTADAATGSGRVMRVVQLLGTPTAGTWGLLFRGAPTINTLAINATSTAVLNAILNDSCSMKDVALIIRYYTLIRNSLDTVAFVSTIGEFVKFVAFHGGKFQRAAFCGFRRWDYVRVCVQESPREFHE